MVKIGLDDESDSSTDEEEIVNWTPRTAQRIGQRRNEKEGSKAKLGEISEVQIDVVEDDIKDKKQNTEENNKDNSNTITKNKEDKEPSKEIPQGRVTQKIFSIILLYLLIEVLFGFDLIIKHIYPYRIIRKYDSITRL